MGRLFHGFRPIFRKIIPQEVEIVESEDRGSDRGKRGDELDEKKGGEAFHREFDGDLDDFGDRAEEEEANPGDHEVQPAVDGFEAEDAEGDEGQGKDREDHAGQVGDEDPGMCGPIQTIDEEDDEVEQSRHEKNQGSDEPAEAVNQPLEMRIFVLRDVGDEENQKAGHEEEDDFLK